MKEDTPEEESATATNEPKAAATKPEARKPVLVEILKTGTIIRRVKCAKGARKHVTADQAKTLETSNLAKIIGV